MEPIEYVGALRRHWKPIVGVVLVAAVALVVTSWPRPRERYTATAVLAPEAGPGAPDPQVEALWATDVPARAADRIGFDGDPARLAQQVTMSDETSKGTVAITATDADPDRAATIANAFADEAATQLPTRYVVLDEAIADEADVARPGPGSQQWWVVALGLVALIGAFAFAFARDRSDPRIRTRLQAETAFGLPVLAEVPSLPAWSRRRRLVAAVQPDSVTAEHHRRLRDALVRSRLDEAGPNTANGSSRNGSHPAPASTLIVVTSARPGEGKTTTVAHLAGAYAETGRSVLVLSGDLSPTSAARRLGINEGAVPRVRVIDTSPAPSAPAGERRLVREARRRADVVIVEVPPLLSTGLSRTLATMADALVVVCRMGHATADEAELCRDDLDRLGASTAGLVLLGTSTLTPSDYIDHVAATRGALHTVSAPADVQQAVSVPTHEPEPADEAIDAPMLADPYVAQVREVCLRLPETAEVEAWGRPTFRAGQKMFAVFDGNDEHPYAVAFRPDPDRRPELLNDPRFYVPRYIGPRGWVALDLDAAPIDWSEVAELVEASYRQVALKRMLKALDERHAPAAFFSEPASDGPGIRA